MHPLASRYGTAKVPYRIIVKPRLKIRELRKFGRTTVINMKLLVEIVKNHILSKNVHYL